MKRPPTLSTPDPPHRSDARLIEACIAGDEAAWERLVRYYTPLVRAIPRRRGLSAAASDDVCQEVFIAVTRHLDSLRDPRTLSKWLMTITHRQTIRALRKQGRTAPDGCAEDEHEPPPDEVVQQWERRRRVLEALTRLGGRCEALLRALFLDPVQPDYQTVADRLKMPVGSVGPVRRRCLAHLAKLLRETDDEDPGTPGSGVPSD